MYLFAVTHEIIQFCMFYVKVHVQIGQREVLKASVVKSDTTNWYQSQGLDTEPRWASGAVFGPKMWREIGPGMANFGCWFVPVRQVVARPRLQAQEV